MNSTERRATFSLASIFALRMLGLFMVLPIFSVYANTLPGATPLLLGISLGIYGLTQAFFQIPFGIWSDHHGRKPIITLGLAIFALGSIITSLSHSIIGVIIGRALQGSGAVGSATLAMVADSTRNEHRTKAMTIIGMAIGGSFTLAMVMGPLLNSWLSVPNIFMLCAVLAAIAILMLYTLVPNAAKKALTGETSWLAADFKAVLLDKELLRLNGGILILHAILTASFIIIPIVLKNEVHLANHQQWTLYLPVLVLAALTAFPLISLAEQKQLHKQLFICTISTLLIAELLLPRLLHHLAGSIISLWLFFTAFTLLEGMIPAFVSKQVPADKRGTAMGIYSTCQFLGIFLGGVIGGWCFEHYDVAGVYLACMMGAGLWLVIATYMKNPHTCSQSK